MENNAGTISAVLGGLAIVGIVILSVLAAPVGAVIGGSCVIVGLVAGSVLTGITYFQRDSEVLTRNARSDEQTALLRPTSQIAMSKNRVNLEEMKTSHSKKRTMAQAAKIEARDALFQSAQLLQLDPSKKGLAFEDYLKAAELGKEESLIPLTTLAEEMNPQQQLKLSQFYGTFLKNEEKADYWQKKGMETQRFQLKK